MNTLEAQHVVRELLVEADALSRVLYAEHEEVLAWRLAALRATLQRIDRRLGSSHPGASLSGELDVAYQRIVDLAATTRSEKLRHLVTSAARLHEQPHPGRAPAEREPAATPPWRSGTPRDVARRAGVELAATAVSVSALAVPALTPRLRRSALVWGIVAGALLISALWSAHRWRS
jgi:hypothetical protein